MEKGVAENNMIRQHQQLNGHEFEQTLGDGRKQEELGVLWSMVLQTEGHDIATE